MRNFQLAIFVMLVTALVGCGGSSSGSSDDHIPMGTLSVSVKDSAADTAVRDASVAVYNSSNALVTTGTTDIDGNFEYSLSPGTYYIRVATQDYLPVPPRNQDAVPFEIIDGQATTQHVALDEHPDAGATGQISGSVLTPDLNGVSGVLVVAKDAGQNLTISGITGQDGDFVLYNVMPGSYTLEVYLAGYREASDPVTVVVAGGSHEAVTIEIAEHANADLYGKVTFLAIVNGVVDITLIHPDTLDTIPGLSTQNDANELTYRLNSVPPGTYIAWASFRNDEYVMDPDSIRKFGLPQVTFTADSADLEQNFDVTGAVSITDPTNEPDLVVPEVVNTATPTFKWDSYSSAKEYIIEVFNSKGETIWGGFDDSGVIQHTQIDQHATSAVFNFDGTATAELLDGETYLWKIYADFDDAQNVQCLISSSEDQMGLFKYVQNPSP